MATLSNSFYLYENLGNLHAYYLIPYGSQPAKRTRLITNQVEYSQHPTILGANRRLSTKVLRQELSSR